MRQLSELIAEVKFNANIEKAEKWTDAVMVRLFDTAQRHIRMVIHNAYPTDPIMAKIKTYTISNGNTFLRLPKDMLTPNSVHNVVPIRSNGGYGESLQRISLIERSTSHGYYVVNDKLYMSPSNYFDRNTGSEIELVYAALLTRLTSVNDVSELPTQCEEYLIQWVEKKINHINSSKDLPNSQVLSKEQKQEIIDLFADAARDPKVPPASNSDYLVY
jgi:hypothetical protein